MGWHDKLTPETKDAIVHAVRDEGRSVKWTADMLGVSIYTVYRVMRARNIAAPRRSVKADRDAQIQRLWRAGWKAIDIAKELNCSKHTIYANPYVNPKQAVRRRAPKRSSIPSGAKTNKARIYIRQGIPLERISAALDIPMDILIEIRKAEVTQ